MNSNRFAQSSKTPYKLITDQGEHGCYAYTQAPRAIGKAMIKNKEISFYKIYDLNDNVVDSLDQLTGNEMTQLITYHNDPKIKAKFLARVKAHYKADEIKKGFYWEEGKGCAVGCTIHGSDHYEYEKQLGIPVGLARLEDNIFENLTNGEAKEWPVKFLSTIKVGVDLEIVGWKFNLWLQVENRKHAVKQKMSQQIIDAIDGVIEYLTPVADGKPIDEAAESAAWSAAESAAESAAWSAAYKKFAKKLLELLADAPKVKPIKKAA